MPEEHDAVGRDGHVELARAVVLKGVQVRVVPGNGAHLDIEAANESPGELPHARRLMDGGNLRGVGEALRHLDVVLNRIHQGVHDVAWDVIPNSTVLTKLWVPARENLHALLQPNEPVEPLHILGRL